MNLENTLWMGGIQPGMTESQILDFFKYFRIFPTHIKFIKDKLKNKNKSYCFISFSSMQEANYVLNFLNGTKIPNTDFIFKFNLADYKGGSKTIYVGNLNPSVTKEDLFMLFKQKYKSVHNARIILNENGKSKGYGFVNFKNDDDYYNSLKEMDGINYFGNVIKVKEQTKKEEDSINNNIVNINKKRKGNAHNNFYIKNNLININNISNNNEILIQNNIVNNNISNNNIYNSIQNNFTNFNNNMIGNINNNTIMEYNNNINNIQNLYGNNNMTKVSNNLNNLLGINNTNNNFLKEDENNINNFNSNQSIDNIINKIKASSIFFNNDKNSQNLKMSNPENINSISFINEQIHYDNITNISRNEENNINNINRTDQSLNEQNSIKIKNKKNERKKCKLEILEKIDEITLYKKIHESILRTFTYNQMLVSKTGVKFKSK